MTAVTIVDYGAGNLRSLRAAFERLGVGVEITAEPGTAERSRLIVVPGVGAAGPAMERLRATGLAGAVRAAADRGAHVLGICLGLQLLFDKSEEGDTECLGLLPGRVRRIDWARTVPHMGWNDVAPAHLDSLAGTLPGGLLLRARLRRRAGRGRRCDRHDRARRHGVRVGRRPWSRRGGAVPP